MEGAVVYEKISPQTSNIVSPSEEPSEEPSPIAWKEIKFDLSD